MATLVEAGLRFTMELGSINEFIDGLGHASDVMDEAAQSGQQVGSVFVTLSGQMSGIPVILERITEEAMQGLGLNNLTESINRVITSIDNLQNESGQLLSEFQTITRTPFKLQLDLPDLTDFKKTLDVQNLFGAINEQFTHTANLIDSSGLATKLLNITTTIKTAGPGNILAKSLESIAKAIERFTKIPDFGKLSPRINSFVLNLEKLSTIATSGSTAGLENLASAIPKLVNAFRSLAQTKNLEEFVKRIQTIIPVFEALSKISIGNFLHDLPIISTGLGTLFKTFKDFSGGKAIDKLPKLLESMSLGLGAITKLFADLPDEKILKFVSALDNISKSFRNFGLAIKNFSADNLGLIQMVNQIIKFARLLDQGLNIDNFVPAITAIADALAKLARALTSFARNKNVIDIKQRFDDLRVGLASLTSLPLDQISKDLAKITGPLKDLATVMRTISSAKEIEKFGNQIRLLNLGVHGSSGPFGVFKSILSGLSPVIMPVVNSLKLFGAELLKLPLKFVIANFNIFKAVFIDLPINAITGTFRAIVAVFETFVTIVRTAAQALLALISPILKIITLGGSLTQIFSFFGGGKTNQQLSQLNSSFKQTQSTLQATGTEAAESAVKFDQFGNAVVRVRTSINPVTSALKTVASGLTLTGIAAAALNFGKIVLFGNSILGLTRRILALGVAVKTLQVAGNLLGNIFNAARFGFQNIIGAAIQATIQFERLQLSVQSLGAAELVAAGKFNTINEALPTAKENANELIASLQALAVQSPFSISEIQNGFVLAQSYGFASDEALQLTQRITDYVTASGRSGEAIEVIARAAGQIRATGKVTLGDVNQLANAGINLREELSKLTGLPVAKVLESISAGAITAEQGIEALNSVLKTQEGAAARAGESLGGLINSLSDLKDAVLRQAFAGLFEALKPFAAQLAAALNTEEIKNQLIGVSNAIRDATLGIIDALAGPIGLVVAAFNSIPDPVKRAAADILKFLAVMGGATIVFTVLNAAILVVGTAFALFINPIGLAAGALLGIAVLIQNNLETFKSLGDTVLNFVAPAFEYLQGILEKFALSTAGVAIQFADFVGKMIATVANLDFGSIFTKFEPVIARLLEGVGKIAEGFSTGFGNIITIVSDSVGNLSDFFGTSLTDITDWGSGLISAFAEGILSTLSIVADALQQLGDVIAYWLAPGSPPRIVPDIDKWGESTAQEFLNGFGEADFNTIEDFSNTFEKLLKTTEVDTSNLDMTEVATSFANALATLKDTGTIDTGFVAEIAEQTGLASEQVVGLVEKYANVEKATQDAANATTAYEKAVAGLNDELNSIDAAEQFATETKQLNQLKKNLQNRNLTESQRAATLQAIAKIEKTQQLRTLKKQQEAAQKNLETQKDVLATEKARIDLANKFQEKGQQADAPTSTKGLSDQAEKVKKVKDETEKLTDAQFKLALAQTDTAGKIALYKKKLEGLQEGSVEYYDTLRQIEILEDKLNKEREAATKKAGKGGPLEFLDEVTSGGAVGKLATLGDTLSQPFNKFKETLDDAKKKYDAFTENIRTRFAAIKKTFEDLGFTGDRLKNIAIGLGVALGAIILAPGTIAILAALASFTGPFLLLGGAIAALVVGFRFFQNKFDLTKTIGELDAVKNALIAFGNVGTSIIKGFTSGDNLIQAALGIKTGSLAEIARSLGAIAGGVVKLFIDFQKNILESVGRIALGANPIDAILTSFLNADYTGTGELISRKLDKFFGDIVRFIQSIPSKFVANLSDENGGIAGIFKAVIETGLQLLQSNPFIDAFKSFLNFDLSKIKINIGGVEFTGGADLGKKLSDLLNQTFGTTNFNFLGDIDFSTPLSVIKSSFELVKAQVIPIIDSIRTTILGLVPPEVKKTLDLVGAAFGVLGLAVEEFKKNFVTEETGAALERLGQAALFAGQQFLKLTGFVLGGLAAIVSLLGVGILPEIPRIITNLANALTALFNFIGTSIQKVIDFVLKGDFTLAAFVNLAIDLFGDLRSTFDTIIAAFGNLSGLIGDAIRNVIKFAGIKFGFNGEAVIKQFEGIINIVSKVGDIALLVFGGILVKSLFTAAKNVSLLRFAFAPVGKAIQLLISPITLLFTIIKRLFTAYKTLGTGIRLVMREQGGFLKRTQTIKQLISALIGILFKGRQGFGQLAKPIAQTGAALATTATKSKGILSIFGKLFGVFGKLLGPAFKFIAIFEAINLVLSATGGLSGVFDIFKSLTGINLDFIKNLLPEGGISKEFLAAFGAALPTVISNLGPMIVKAFGKINISGITTVLKNVFSKLDLSTVFTIFTTFPGLIKKFFSPSIFSGLFNLFSSTFGKIAGLFTPVINIVTKFGGLFSGLLPLLLNPITLIIGGVTLLGLAWYNNWFNIREVTANVIKWLQDNIPGLAKTALQWLIDAVAQIPTYAANFVSAVINGLSPIVQAIYNAGATWVVAALAWITQAIAEAPARIQELVTTLTKNLLLGALGALAFGATMLINFFQWIPGAVAAIPSKLQELWAGFSNWFTNTFVPLFTTYGPKAIQALFDALTTAANAVNSVLAAIGAAIINGIIAGVQLAMADPRISTVLQPLMDKFNTFVNGPTGILTVATNVFNGFTKLASDIATVVFANPFEQITAFISGDQGILTTIGNVYGGFTQLVANLTGVILPNPFALLATFIEGDDGIIAKITGLIGQFNTFVSDLTAIVIPNPFAALMSVITGEKSIYQAVVDLGTQFSTFVSDIGALVIPNPFTVLTDVLIGENSLLTLVANLGTQFQTFVQTLTGIVLPNPFTILQAVFQGEGGLPSAITAFSTQIETFATSLDALLIPNILLPIQVGLEALKTLFPGFTTEISNLQSFINGLTFTNIFQGLIDAMSNLTALVQPIIDKFNELSAFFTDFVIPNPFANVDFEIPEPLKAAMRFAGIDLGESTGEEIATSTTDTAAEQLTNADIPITVSSSSLDAAKTEGQTLGKNVAEGVAQGAQTAAEDPGFFGGVQKSVTDTWNSIWGSNSPSKVADETMGQPIGQGILQGITTAFTAATPGFITALTTFFKTVTDATIKFQDAVLKLFTDFFKDVLDMLDTFIADVIKKITEMVNRFLAQINRLARETLAILTTFLSNVTTKMQQFVTIMETAARNGVDAFVTYIEENFVDRVGAALEAAFGALQSNEDLLKVVKDGGIKIGEEFVKGIIEGFENQSGPLEAAVRALVQSIMSTAENEAGIASPSKEASARIGRPLGAGILSGFMSTRDSLINGVESVVGGILSTNYADRVSSFARSQITDPFTNAMNAISGFDIAQNVNLKYNGMINSLPNLLQSAAISSTTSLQQMGQMRTMQQTVMPNTTYAPNSYVNSRNEKHYHMHLTTTPDRAMKIQRNFRVAEHLGITS